MSESVLVTGASGYIGYKLCESLFEAGEKVRVVLRNKQDGPWHNVVEADLSQDLPDDLMPGISTVFHLAGKAHALDSPAQNEKEYFSINSDATKNLLVAGEKAGVEKFIYFSSVKALREQTDHCLDESSETRPETVYGRSKLAAEQHVLQSSIAKRIVIRPGMVYGPECKGNLPRLVKLAQKRYIPAFPEVSNHRSLISIDDLVKTTILLANASDIESSVFHLTEPKPYSTNEIMDAIYKGLDRKQPSLTLPKTLLIILARIGDVISRISGKPFAINSSQLQKFSGSACYTSEKVQAVPGVEIENRLNELMPRIIESL